MKPLDGIKVLDLSQLLSGPTCTNMLKLLGAEVIKIERPKVGDAFRDYTEHSGPPGFSMPFVSCNSGKKSVALDYTTPEAKEVIRRLAKQSDIVVENFRPGVTKKHGVDWDSLRAVNPKLVYCSISGFGQYGPLRDWGALDQVVQAISGILWMNGAPGDGPVKVGFPVMDTFTGYLAVIAILAALRRRDATGEGEYIDIAMLDAAMRMMGAPVASTLMSQKPPARFGSGGYRLVATSDMFESGDGRFLSIGAQSQPQFEALCRILEIPELIDDPRFGDHQTRVDNSAPLQAAIKGAFKKQTAFDIEQRLAAVKVPVGVVRDMHEILGHPHFEARGTFVKADVPGLPEPAAIMGAGFALAGETFEAGPAPKIGEHTDAVLASLGYDASAIAKMRERGVC